MPEANLRRRVRHCFNMIEIVIAMGIIAIGVIGVMGLFPIGVNANRDAMAENYAADSAQQFLQMFAHWLKSDTLVTPSKTAWEVFIDDTSTSSKPDAAAEISATWTDSDIGPNIKSANIGMYRITQTTGSSEISDFTGIYRVWYTQVNGLWYDKVDNIWKKGNIPLDIAMALNVELSWPAVAPQQLPYNKRQRSRFYLEVFNPNYEP